MAKRHHGNGNNENYKEVDTVNENEVKDVETNETVNVDQKPEGENKPETKPEEKKEGFIKRMSKKKWVRVGLCVIAGVACGTAGALIGRRLSSDEVTDVLQGVQDKLPEIATTAKDSVAAIADNHPVDVTVDQVVADKVTTF